MVGLVLLVLAAGTGIAWVASNDGEDATASANPSGEITASANSETSGGEYDAVSNICAVDLSSFSDWVDPLPSGESIFDDTSDIRDECAFGVPDVTTGFAYAHIDATVFGDATGAEAALDMLHSVDASYNSSYHNSATCDSSSGWSCIEEDVMELGDRSYGLFNTGTSSATTSDIYTYQLTMTDDNLLLLVVIGCYCDDGTCVDSASVRQHTVDLASEALEFFS